MNVQNTANVNFQGRIIESYDKREFFNKVEKSNYRTEDFKAAVNNFIEKQPKKDTVSIAKEDYGNYNMTHTHNNGVLSITGELKGVVDCMCKLFGPKK